MMPFSLFSKDSSICNGVIVGQRTIGVHRCSDEMFLVSNTKSISIFGRILFIPSISELNLTWVLWWFSSIRDRKSISIGKRVIGNQRLLGHSSVHGNGNFICIPEYIKTTYSKQEIYWVKLVLQACLEASSFFGEAL